MDEAIYRRLFRAAARARRRAHCPVSGLAVGAALLTEGGRVHAGTNVEDPALNHTVHAEAGAIGRMVAEGGRQRVTHLVTVPCVPCGHCRQLLVEFADDAALVAVADAAGRRILDSTLGALYPHAFRLSHFGDRSPAPTGRGGARVARRR